MIVERWEAPRRFRHRREGAAAQEGPNLRSNRWVFIRFSCYFFKIGFYCSKIKFLVELGVDLSFFEVKRHSEQD
jgi:hypothetical protein